MVEIQIIGYPFQSDQTRHEEENTVLPDNIKLVVDSIVVRDLDSRTKVKLHNYRNGFTNNRNTKDIGRLCFSVASSESGLYSGAFNMATSSNLRLEFQFSEKCHYAVYAVVLQSNQISATGVLQSFLD